MKAHGGVDGTPQSCPGASVVGRSWSSNFLDPAKSSNQIQVMSPSPSIVQGASGSPHSTTKHALVPTGYFQPTSRPFRNTGRRKMLTAWVIAPKYCQSRARRDNIRQGFLLVTDMSSAGLLCQAWCANLGKALLVCSALGYWDPV